MNREPRALPDELRRFVDESHWTYAKTMPKWPHEYLVRDRVDEALFLKLVQHIRANGQSQRFYQETYLYFEEDGLLYWTMGAPLDETTIVNRCKSEDSFENRERNGTLPT